MDNLLQEDERMSKKGGRFYRVTLLCLFLVFAPHARAQQTLGGMTGTITDDSGAVIPAATVTIVGDQTKLTRSADTSDTGTYSFVNLPIGNYTITVTHSGFQKLNIPSIQVQADRTATVNGTLKIGEVGQAVTVQEAPLVNAVDTTNGYVMDKAEIDAIPLPTGSFTGLVLRECSWSA
jgi:Carboxypeptidase regulatory-like domain